jgi:hypothetical protein
MLLGGNSGVRPETTPFADVYGIRRRAGHRGLGMTFTIAVWTKSARQSGPRDRWTWRFFGARIGLVGDPDRPVRVQ